MGHTDDKKLPLTWNAKTGENVLWKVELPLQVKDAKNGVDQNQSSPIAYRGRVFVTVSHWSGKTDPKQHPEHRVVCYNADDGKLLWNEKVEPGPWLFADLRGGYTAPAKTVPASVYPDQITRTTASAVGQAKAFVFDLSDLQPASFGATVGQGEFKIFQDLLRNPSNASGVASSLERAATRAYKAGK